MHPEPGPGNDLEAARLILESMSEAVVAVDAQGNVIYFNRTASTLLGVDSIDAPPAEWPARYGLYREDRTTLHPAAELPLLKALEGEASDEQILFVRNRQVPEGSFLGATGRPLRARDGTLLGGLVVFRDVSERIRRYEVLEAERVRAREREHFFAGILDHVAHPIFVKDRAFRWVFLNQAFCAMVGRSREELLGKSDYDFFPKSEADFFRQKDIEMFTRRARVEIEEEPITDASGRRHLLATTKVPLMDEAGEVTHLVGIIHDITQLKRAEQQARRLAVEQAARASAERAHSRAAFLSQASRTLAYLLVPEATLSTVARIPIGTLGDVCVVALTDEEGVARVKAVAYKNAERERRMEACLVGAPVKLPQDATEHLPRTDRTLADLVVGRDHSCPAAELPVRSWLSVPLRTPERKMGVFAFGSTTRSRVLGREDVALAEELALRVALALEHGVLYEQAQQAIRIRDEFLQIASHELRTPLTSLKIQLQRLLRDGARAPGVPDESLEALRRLLRKVDQLALLVTNLLDVSSLMARRLTLSRELVDLSQLVQDAVASFSEEAARAGSRIQVDLEPGVRGLWDATRIQQVVTNLISNALKFGAGRPIEISVRRDGPNARLRVRDHGIGIASEDVDRIFGRFERAVSSRHFGGLGLGLFITREIVEAHGGEIHVDSRHGQGSTFTVLLPRAAHLEAGWRRGGEAPSPSPM